MNGPESIEALRAAAAAGELMAQYNLGVSYLSGDAGQRDPAEARAWFTRAAERDFAPAQSALAYLHLRAQGAPYDPAGARELFARAAEGGFVEAQYRLAELTVTGLGGPGDAEQGRAWFERAAGGGHPQAQCQLAYCLEHGIGGAVDAAASTAWYLEAAQRGEPRAQTVIAERYLRGHTLPPDPVKAAAWYALAGSYPGAAESGQALAASLDEAERQQVAEWARSGPPTDTPDPERLAPLPAPVAEVMRELPRVVRLRGLALPEECHHLIRLATPFLKPSRVLSRATGELVETAGRRSGGMSIIDPLRDVVVWSLERRIAAQAAIPLENGEPLSILHYTPGDEYRPHYDFFDPENPKQVRALLNGGQRLVSVLTYLCGVAEGGETVFPDIGLEVRPEPGTAVLFHNCSPQGTPDWQSRHAGAPVRQGEKWLATKWIREMPFAATWP